MTTFTVTLSMEIEAYDLDEARQFGYDVFNNGQYAAELQSECAYIKDYNVEVVE